MQKKKKNISTPKKIDINDAIIVEGNLTIAAIEEQILSLLEQHKCVFNCTFRQISHTLSCVKKFDNFSVDVQLTATLQQTESCDFERESQTPRTIWKVV